MKSFSNFCIALSAAALLTASLTGQAQSQFQSPLKLPGPYAMSEGAVWANYKGGPYTRFDPRGGIFSSQPGFDTLLTEYYNESGEYVTGALHLSRGEDGKTKRLLTLRLSPKWDSSNRRRRKPVMFTDMEIKPDGSYSKKLTDGHYIRGTIPNLTTPNTIPNLTTGRMTGWTDMEYTDPNGQKASIRIVKMTTNRQDLRRLMFVESQHYSTDNYRENLERAEDIAKYYYLDRYLTKTYLPQTKEDYNVLARPTATYSSREHLERGASLMARGAELSLDLRLRLDATMPDKFQAVLSRYADPDVQTNGDLDPYRTPLRRKDSRARNIRCEGMACTAKLLGKTRVTVFQPGDLAPNAAEAHEEAYNVDTVLANQGVYLAIDRSTPTLFNDFSRESFGAWMDDAGFFVVTGSWLRGPYNRVDGVSTDVPARAVVAVGERTGSHPEMDAVWRGSMVGTAMAGLSKDNLLRGEAELTFDIGDSMLDARFFNIRDYDRFGEEYISVRGVKPNQILFPDIPAAADGSYAKKYRKRRGDNHNGSIRGAFYGVGHGETAGTFKTYGLLGAFGAKRVELAN